MKQLTLSDIAEAAGVIAIHASQISAGPVPLDGDRLYDYMTLSRQRLRLWIDAVEQFRRDPTDTGQLITLSHEVLVSEVLNRVAAAVLVASDAHRRIQHATPFARRAHLDLLQARQAVLSLVVDQVLPLGAALRINQLRRRTERWADFLVSSIRPFDAVAEFAVDEARCSEFRSTSPGVWNSGARAITLAALRHAMPDEAIPCAERARLQMTILKRVFSFLPTSAFHDDGRLRSPRLHQFFDTTLLADRAEVRVSQPRSSRLTTEGNPGRVTPRERR